MKRASLFLLSLVGLVGCSTAPSDPLEPVTGTEGYLPVRSKVFHSVRHDPGTDAMHIRFRDGKELVYTGVPREIMTQFLRTSGKVGVYEGRIKGCYPWEMVRRAHDPTGRMVQYRGGLFPDP